MGMHVLSRAISEGLVPAERTAIIDPHSELFAQWHRRVRNCRMDFLRSPASHGIARDYRTIRRTIQDERDFTPPYHRPSVRLFGKHLNHQLRNTLNGTIHIQGTAQSIHIDDSGSAYRIDISPEESHRSVTADVIILAVGQPSPRIPEPLKALPATASVLHVHNDTSSLQSLNSGSKIGLVGGGIAAAHLAVALASAGHDVTIWNRDRFTSHQFDSDPCFVGPRCASLFASIQDYSQRRILIQRSRRAGSVPPDLFVQLRRLQQERRIRVVRGSVTHAAAAGSQVFLSGWEQIGEIRYPSASVPGPAGEYDAVVACTGFDPGPPACELVEAIAHELQLKLAADGYPVPSHDLQWAPALFVAGALAELEIGPPARNLVGAHVAGRRIIPSLNELLTARR